MPRYRFTTDYRSDAGAWKAGEEAELDEATIAWLNRDIPGCVEPVEDDDTPTRQQPKRQNRQQRGKQNRSA